MTESELRSLIRSSQEIGFKKLFQQYQSYVYSIVWEKLKSTGMPDSAEECVSDIFAHVFLHFDEINEGNLKAYIGTVSKRMAIDKYRSLKAVKNNMSDNDERLDDISCGEDIEKNAENSETSRILLEKIKSLGEPDSTIIIHKYYYDRNSNEIAEYVHMKPIAVRVRLNRALKRLKILLTDEGISL